MKTRSLRAQTSTISKSRWLAYATASAASMFSAGQCAEAAIHYSGGIDSKFNGNYSVRFFPLTSGASLEFFRSRFAYFLYDQFAVVGARKSWAYRGKAFSVEKLSSRQNVSSGKFFEFFDYPGILASAQYRYGNFLHRGVGFVGFKFNGGAGTHYGWARLKFSGPPNLNFTLLDYAWADVGESILTGQTKEKDKDKTGNAIPDSGSLGALALGGAGLMAWRKRRRSTGTGSVAAAPIL